MTPDPERTGDTASRRRRIARVIARLNVGGPARHVVWLTADLNDDRHESMLITGVVPPGETDMSEFALRHGVRPVVLNEMSREISPLDLIAVVRLFLRFRRFRPDVIHTHTAKAGALGRLAGLVYRCARLPTRRGRRVAIVHTYHGHVFDGYYPAWKSFIFLTIERILARFTDAIVVLSEQQREEIAERLRMRRSRRIRIVPLGIDFETCAPDASAGRALRAELGIGADDPLVGIVGRLAPVKNQALFLQAASRFLGEGRDARFVLFGDGAERDRLDELVRALELGPHVLFAGMREPAAIYGATDLVALTSLNEGTPLTIIEAMVAGRPVVSTAVGGVVDLLGRVERTVPLGTSAYQVRERGITVPSADASALAAAFARILDDSALRLRLTTAAAVHARRTYSRERLVRNIIRLYDDLDDPDREQKGEPRCGY